MFRSYDIAPGARVHIQKDDRFRRTNVTCFLSGPLKEGTAAPVALLPAVLVRGTARLNQAHLLEREMAALFGARMGAGIAKSGDRQIVRVGLNLPSEKYAGVPVLGDGLSFLKEILSDPYLPNGAFDPSYVGQEKMQLIGRIRAMVNNKLRYAMQHGIKMTFAGEPAALSEEGTEETVSPLTPEDLVKAYREVVSGFQMDLYIVGDVDEDAGAELVKSKLTMEGRTPIELPHSIVKKGEGPMETAFATEPMEQGWAIFGIKSGVRMGTQERWTLSLVNGLLGGYPHSKLFSNVREKASLAYSAGSFMDATKGVVFAYAGIDPKNYRKATDMMLEQLKAIARGEVAKEEFDSTVEAMTTDLRLQLDSPGYLVHTHFAASGEGVYEDVPTSLEALGRVTLDEAIAMAGQLRPATRFFLSGLDEAQLRSE